MDTSFIGHEFTPKDIIVEAGQLRFFAKSTREKNDIYWSEEAAIAAGHPSLPAPPTFLFSLDILAPNKDKSILELLGIDIGKILHAEQRFKYIRQIYAGDKITLNTKIADMYEKKGGALQFVVSEITATNQNNEIVGSMTSSLVVRN